MKQAKPKRHRYLYKASWRGTALRFFVEAHNEDEAERKAARQVMRMQGGISCLGLELVREEGRVVGAEAER